MGAAIITFTAAFLLISMVGFAVTQRQRTLQRLSKAVAPPLSADVLRDAPPERTAEKVARLVEPLQRVLPKSREEISVIEKRLARAGYREAGVLSTFYASKVLVPGLLFVCVALSGVYDLVGYFSFIMALGLGFVLPDFWLGNRIKARQLNLHLGLPDALDLIIICVEAGLGMDRAVQRATQELQLSQPQLADELGLLSLEQQAGRTRVDAWKNLGERTDVESIRALAAILIQADKFGTGVGKALRAHAESLRTRRRQEAEEQAAKITVKLIFPLVLFIFPALFVVTLGPSMITIMEQMQNFLN